VVHLVEDPSLPRSSHCARSLSQQEAQLSGASAWNWEARQSLPPLHGSLSLYTATSLLRRVHVRLSELCGSLGQNLGMNPPQSPDENAAHGRVPGARAREVIRTLQCCVRSTRSHTAPRKCAKREASRAWGAATGLLSLVLRQSARLSCAAFAMREQWATTLRFASGYGASGAILVTAAIGRHCLRPDPPIALAIL
jgi:hypothetical protein